MRGKITVKTSGRCSCLRIFRDLLAVMFGLSIAAHSMAGETITFFHNDIAGSPQLASDVNGIQVWKETYRPYGDRLIDASASANNDIWFTGKSFDEDTGLSYMGARYYDPMLGRFMAIDPVSVDPSYLHSFNRYAYANNNPFRYIDPNGEWAISVNVGFWSGSVGRDSWSGQFFWAQKIGIAGVGLSFDPGKDAPRGEGRLDRPCDQCGVESVSWERGNIEAGIQVGPLSWQPFEYDAGSLVTEHLSDAGDFTYFVEGQGMKLDLFDLESVFNGGEGGWNLDLEANYEWGATISWKDFREALGLEPIPELKHRNPIAERSAGSTGGGR